MPDIDCDLLFRTLKERKITKEKFSMSIGKTKNYISNLKTRPTLTDVMETLICKMLDLQPSYFVKREEYPEEVKVPAIFENLFKKCERMETLLSKVIEDQEAIYKKCNTNVIQLEKLRRCIEGMSQSEYDRAVEFLQRTLKDGRINAFDLMQLADEQGIKRSELMKAKKELNVIVDASGYGKNQKSWWYLQ